MMFIRNLTKSQAIKGMASRQLSTNPARADMFLGTTPVLRTNVPSVTSIKNPATVTAKYDIKESPLHYEVSVNIPKGIVDAGDLLVEVEQGAKALRVSGSSAKHNFAKRFAWGGTMDVDRLTTDLKDGVLFIQAPKIHCLNGNSPYADMA